MGNAMELILSKSDITYHTQTFFWNAHPQLNAMQGDFAFKTSAANSGTCPWTGATTRSGNNIETLPRDIPTLEPWNLVFGSGYSRQHLFCAETVFCHARCERSLFFAVRIDVNGVVTVPHGIVDFQLVFRNECSRSFIFSPSGPQPSTDPDDCLTSSERLMNASFPTILITKHGC